MKEMLRVQNNPYKKRETPAPPSGGWGVRGVYIACILCISGLVLLFLGLFLPPEGEIHASVLVAFGEISTFSGSLFGIDYCYRRGDNEK